MESTFPSDTAKNLRGDPTTPELDSTALGKLRARACPEELDQGQEAVFIGQGCNERR